MMNEKVEKRHRVQKGKEDCLFLKIQISIYPLMHLQLENFNYSSLVLLRVSCGRPNRGLSTYTDNSTEGRLTY